jgi:hypothetical protein
MIYLDGSEETFITELRDGKHLFQSLQYILEKSGWGNSWSIAGRARCPIKNHVHVLQLLAPLELE